MFNATILMEKLNRNSRVVEKLREFKGTIIGNSAGAVALSKKEIDLHERENVYGLGLVNYSIIVHFNFGEYKKLDEITSRTIAISENSAIVFKGNKIIDFRGKVLLFKP